MLKLNKIRFLSKNKPPSSEILRNIAGNISLATLYITNNTIIFNKLAESIIGYTNNEILNIESLIEILHIDRTSYNIYKRNKSTRTSFSKEIYLVDKNKKPHTVNITFYFDEYEELWLLHELTDYKQREHLSQTANDRFRHLVDLSSDWYWEQDENYRFTFHSGGTAERASNQIIGKTRWEIPAENMSEADWKIHMEMLEARKPFYDLVLKRRDTEGKLVYVSASGKPIFDNNGVFKGYRGIGRNITASKIAEESLRDSEERFRSLTELSSDWYWEQDKNFRFTFISQQIKKNSELRPEEFIGKTRWDIKSNLLTQEEIAQHKAHLEAHLPFRDFGFKHKLPNGSIGYVSISGEPIFDRQGNFTGYRGVGKNVTEAKTAEEVIRGSEERFRNLTELSSDWYWEQDENYRFTFMSEGVRDKTGLEYQGMLGKTRWEIPRNINALTKEEWDTHKALLKAHQPFYDLIFKLEEPGQSTRYVTVSGKPIFDRNGNFKGYRGVGRDITKNKTVEQRIEYLAYHDNLTGLPNRALFTQHLNHALNRCKRAHQNLAIFFIDLDRFKNINDTLGHDAGDKLLQEAAKRLSIELRDNDILARLGGDEFIVLIEEVGEPQDIVGIAKKILTVISKPFLYNGNEYYVTASIGISIFPDDSHDAQSLMKNADIAMYRAKDQGKNNYQFYSSQVNTHTFERLALESSLRHAIENNEFLLYYQPKFDIQSGKITGAEALVRWLHPHMGMVPPVQFIPLAEETRLIVPIGKWILRTACMQCKSWEDKGLNLTIAVNLSLSQFSDENFFDDVSSILKETRVNPSLLQFEITESSVMQNAEKTISLLSALKQLGPNLAIDDFGVGYSSLAQLKRFPIDTIKIDRSFIKDLPNDDEDCAIAEAIIAMSKALDLCVIAEGVETKEQLAFLQHHRCDEAQGFYFSPAIPAPDFINLIKTK